MTAGVQRVLIAHQSTIPHYRVPFYRAVERQRPEWWEFRVLHDAAEARRNHYRPVDPERLGFPVREVRSLSVGLVGRRLLLQPRLLAAGGYELLVVGNQLRNLSYPLCCLLRAGRRPVAIWGQGRDTMAAPGGLADRLKLALSRRVDGFFAYTEGVRSYLVEHGVAPPRVFTLQNTIDVLRHRREHERLRPCRERLRARHGHRGRRLLLFAGRLEGRKGLDFLAETVARLRRRDDRYHLLVVGEGDRRALEALESRLDGAAFTFHGGLEDRDLAELMAISDLYVLPGAVGLGPLHALCFDLTPVVVDSPRHNPEFEYLGPESCVICPAGSGPADYAAAIDRLLDDPERRRSLRQRAWPSIRHLTVETMAANFVRGVETLLGEGRERRGSGGAAA